MRARADGSQRASVCGRRLFPGPPLRHRRPDGRFPPTTSGAAPAHSAPPSPSPSPPLIPPSLAVSLPGLVADVGRSKGVRTRTGRAQNVTYDDSCRGANLRHMHKRVRVPKCGPHCLGRGGHAVSSSRRAVGLRAVARKGLLLPPPKRRPEAVRGEASSCGQCSRVRSG